MEAITRIRKALPPTKAVIGFSAAPFTLAAYLVEGGTSRDFNATRKFLYTTEPASRPSSTGPPTR